MRAIDRLLRNRPKAGGLSLLGKIRALFANGEQGWWYDPSNFSTLYQDSAGTTPVTAVEQPVGLQLDLSKGLVLGPELFSTFTSTGTWTVSGNTYSITSAAGQTDLRVDYTGTVGKRYVLSFTATGVSGSVSCFPLNTTPFSYVNGTNTIRESSNAGFFIIRVTTGASSTITNISVKELPGNHRFQTTSANRPVVSARVNLLTKTEQFDNEAWAKSNATVSANAATAPDGTLTAGKLVQSVGVTRGRVTQSGNTSTGYVISVYAKAAEWGFVVLGITNGGGRWGLATFNLLLGTTAGGANYGGDSVDTATITTAGNGWYRCSVRVASGFSPVTIMPFNQSGDAVNPSPSLTGDGTSGIYIWGADLRPINQGVNLPAYQRVNTSTDYDSTGFPVYIKPNGSNQFMQTNSINFTATDKMTVWQGVRKLSDQNVGSIAELSADVNANAGTFWVFAPNGGSQTNWNFRSRGTTGFPIATQFGKPAPDTAVLTGIGNISGDITQLRYNGVVAATDTTDQGTGNYGNYPVYFYTKGGTSLFLNGNDYGSIARGAASTAAQITAGETYINSKTRAFA